MTETEEAITERQNVESNELWTKIATARQNVRDVDGLRGYVEQDPNRWNPVSNRRYKCHKTLRGHLAKVYALQWCGDSSSRNIVSASQDGKLLIWDAITGNKIHAIPLQNAWVMTCAYATGGSFVAAGGLDNCCSVYTLRQPGGATQKERCRLEGHNGYLSCCRFLSDDQQMMTASGDHTSRLWDIENKNEITRFRGHEADVMTIALSPDGRTMVTGACDKLCKLWDIRSGQCTQTFETDASDINSVAFHPSGFAFGCGTDAPSPERTGECLLFDIRSDQRVAEYSVDLVERTYGITSVDFSRSGSIIYAGMDTGDVFAWDVPTGAEAGHLRGGSGHDSRVNCLQVSPDGQAIVTGSWDTTLKIWN